MKDTDDNQLDKPGYPIARDIHSRNDEIDLVDVSIFLWSRRKLFLYSAVVFAIIGILGTELNLNSRPMVSVRSVISTESLGIDGDRIRLISPDGLVRRIEYVKLPQYSSIDKFHPISPYISATLVTSPRNSGLLEIVTTVPVSAETEAVDFHNQLVDDILGELGDSPNSPSAEVRSQLFAMKSGMIRSQELMISLNSGLTDFQPSTGTDLQLENQVARDMRDLQTEIKILSESVKFLEQMFPVIRPIVLVKASVFKATSKSNKTMLYPLIILAAFFLALLVLMCDTFISRVRERMATGG